jgi:hypothetical protein
MKQDGCAAAMGGIGRWYLSKLCGLRQVLQGFPLIKRLHVRFLHPTFAPANGQHVS